LERPDQSKDFLVEDLFQKRCKPGMSHIPNTGVRLREEADKAADLLFDALRDPQDASSFPRVGKGPIIEAFPNAFLGVCLDDDVFAGMPLLRRGKKFDWLYERWQSKRLVEKLPGLTIKERDLFHIELDKTGHHEHRAALICVLTGLLTAHRHFTAIGDVRGGWFFLPPCRVGKSGREMRSIREYENSIRRERRFSCCRLDNYRLSCCRQTLLAKVVAG
jgi:hypothetical protein